MAFRLVGHEPQQLGDFVGLKGGGCGDAEGGEAGGDRLVLGGLLGGEEVQGELVGAAFREVPAVRARVLAAGQAGAVVDDLYPFLDAGRAFGVVFFRLEGYLEGGNVLIVLFYR